MSWKLLDRTSLNIIYIKTKPMNNLRLLRNFLEKAMHDQRIGPSHISLYLGIFQRWVAQNFPMKMPIVKTDLMRLSKLNGRATYYRIIRELHEFGYIEYFPGFGKVEPSQVKMTQLTVIKCLCLLGLKFKLGF